MREYQEKTVIGDCTLYLANCLDVLPFLPAFDAVITDPPYGMTQCSWDSVIPLDDMWEAMKKVTAKKTPVVIFGAEPFSSTLRMSNLRQFKYDWIWHKSLATGFLNAKKQPLRRHEIISVFCDGAPPYHPQKTVGHKRRVCARLPDRQSGVYSMLKKESRYDSTERYPTSVLSFASCSPNTRCHPTQKPVELLKYLVNTYSTAGATILDFAMGSGTTGVACAMLGRKFTGIETIPEYYEIACQRIADAYAQPDMLPGRRWHNG